MKIVVDQNIRAAESTYGAHGRVERIDGRAIGRRHLRDADALIVRTATRVDGSLLAGTPVGFVGSTTIGTDHIDLAWLEREGIVWANAPGCNADAAAGYTLAMIRLACRRLGYEWETLRAGVIGHGHVGSQVRRLLTALGVDTVANDPPLQECGTGGLVPLEEALGRDIVCVHTPLTRSGPHPTLALLSRGQLAAMPDGGLLINTARGEVIDHDPLLAELGTGRLHACLDVWPNEPCVSRRLLEAVTVGTPHVAGYSEEGRRAGALRVYRAFCDWAGAKTLGFPEPEDAFPELCLKPGDDPVDAALEAACFVKRHDRAMRRLAELPRVERAKAFDALRRDYPERHDFHAWRILGGSPEATTVLRKLGFRAEAPGICRTA